MISPILDAEAILVAHILLLGWLEL
jgi:hypothetical protein